MKKLVNVAIMATLVIFATTAIFVGCKKEENKVVDKTQVVSKNQKNGINNFFEVENNPYFFVGDFHNQGLDFIIENINEETLLNLFDEEHIFDDEYILENESIFKDEILRYTKIFSESIGWESPIDIETEFCMINETIDLSMFLFEDQIERWNNLLSAVFEGDEEKSIHEVELLCSDFNDYVNNEVGNEEQQAALYAASSVLLSSYAYWFNEFNKGSNSLWFKYIDEELFEEEFVFGVQGEDIVRADALGALGGAVYNGIRGAAGCSVIPGAGTITGAIAGALVGAGEGALVASATEAGWKVGETVCNFVKGLFN